MGFYVQKRILIQSDPLGLAARLVQRISPRPCFLYERDREWSVAIGAAIEIIADRHGVRSSALERAGLEQLDMRSIEGTVRTADPLGQIGQILRLAPWKGWRAYGTVSFELAGVLHGLPAEDDDNEPFARVIIPKTEVRIRHGEAIVRATAEKQLADAIELIESLHTEGFQQQWPKGLAADFAMAMPEDSSDALAYKDLVLAATQSISEQKLQKVIASRVVSVPWPINMVATYVAGRRMNTPARSFFVREDGGLEFAGFSPETVVEVQSNGEVSTQPLAGTRALGSDATERKYLRNELLSDCKELAEHAVSVKLAFEELEAVCARGTVSVSDFMTVAERGSVQHLASRLRGRLGDGNGAWSALRALFPAVTATGIPKREAVDWIRTHEPERRRHYSGAVLVADQDGSLDAALVLRTVFQRNHQAWIHVGAGIVAQSTPKRELRETYEKLACVACHLVPVSRVHAMINLRELVAQMLDVSSECIASDDSLIDWGMDSIRMMRVAASLRNDGVDVDFTALVTDPRLSTWEALVAERQRGGSQGAPHQDLEVDESAPFELAPMQHAYWVGRDRGRSFGRVAAHFYYEFDGFGVEPPRLEAAVRQLIARHAMLRVQILGDGKQRILSGGGWSGLTVHDLRENSYDEAKRELESIRQRLSHHSMDVAAGEVFDVQLSLLPNSLRPRGTRVHVNLDMLAADALSLRVLLADLAKLYANENVRLPEIRYSFLRYLRARRLQRGTPQEQERHEIDRRYWQDRLADFPSASELPRVSRSDDVPTTAVRRNYWLAPPAVCGFIERARRAHVTPAMAFAAAFAEVLTAWSREPRFFINVPLFDREPLHEDVSLLVGDFTSSVLVEWNGAAAGSFSERARRLQDQFRSDAEHSRYSGIDVLRDLSRARGEQVLAPIVYTSALGLGELFPQEIRSHFGTPSWIISQGPQVSLDAQVTELNGGLLLSWDAREQAFIPPVLDDMFSAYRNLLERLSVDDSAWTEPPAALAPIAQILAI